MADVKTPLETDLSAFFAEEHAASAAGGHEDPEVLLEYLHGDQPEDAGRRIRDHLEVCRECTEALLGLAELARPDEPGSAELELAAAWRTFRERVGPRVEREPRRRWWPRAALRAAATVLFAATLILSWEVARLRGALAGRAAPQVNVPVVYLEPTRDGGLDARLGPGPDAEVFVIFLMLGEPGAFPEYEVDVLGTGDEPQWTGRGLTPSESGSLRIALSRDFLAPGDYRIRLFGVAGAGREPIDEYRIEIR